MKLCKDCKHYSPPGLWHPAWCNNRLLTGDNLETGEPNINHTFTMRDDRVKIFHEMGKTCGSEATHFEPISPSHGSND